MPLSLVTAPASEPITATEAKLHARIDHTTEDALVAEFIAGARELFEEETGRQLVTATWRLTLDRFPSGYNAIKIPRPPLASITSIQYVDTDGTLQTWASSEYDVMTHAGPLAAFGTVQPKPDQSYPDTYLAPDAVRITFVAGVAAADIPMSAKNLLYQLTADQYLSREAQIVGTIVAENLTLKRALNRFRIPAYA